MHQVRNANVLMCVSGLFNNQAILNDIESSNCAVSHVESPKDAWALLQHKNIDVVIIEQAFADGFAFCKQIKDHSRLRTIPILFLVNSDDAGLTEKAFQCGATDCMPQPLNLCIFQHRFRHVLQASARMQKIREKEQNKHLFDRLTGLHNRKGFFAKLKPELGQESESTATGAIIVIDIDDFAQVNQQFEKHQADIVLKEMAERLSTCLRIGDLLMRDNGLDTINLAQLSGDEFIIYLSGEEAADNAKLIAERCVQSLGQPIEIKGQELTLTASAGIALYAGRSNAIKLIDEAECALQQIRKLNAA